jgi:tetratricopeptide (TPR) repeat protein
MPDEPELIFVHHAGKPDDLWAEWVAWQLEEAGFRVELDLWHWRVGDDFVTKMNEALERCSGVVAVLSPHYFEPGRNTEVVWGPVVGRLDRLIPVVVRPLAKHHMPPILSSRIVVELYELDENAAVEALLRAVRGSCRPQLRPGYPHKAVIRPQPPFPPAPSSSKVVWGVDRAQLGAVQPVREPADGESVAGTDSSTTRPSQLLIDRHELAAGDRAGAGLVRNRLVSGLRSGWDYAGQPEAVDTAQPLARIAEPLGRPIRDVDPYHLEVHPAFAMPGAEGLPTYVERQHDKRLRDVVGRAAEGHSQFVILVGTSSSGKTRACYEALRELPDDWRLWHPYNPDRPRAALAQLACVGPRTVVWLNEAHHYLLDIEHSEAIAAGLRTLLSDDRRAPVLVLGTIWPGPGYFDELRSSPPTAYALRMGAEQPTQRDPFSQARLLVAGHDLHVPTSFSSEEVARTRQSSDPRLVDAAQSARDGMVTQYLAAAFELVAIYNQAPPDQRALLDAAVDARRLGHPPRLPLPFLLDAAEAYLTDTEWDLLPEDWHQPALAQLAAPVKGVQGPLCLVKRPRGTAAANEPTPEPAYRVADYLLDHLRAVRRTQPVPSLFWQAAVRHCDGQAARDLALAASSRGLRQVACLLWARAGEFAEVGRQLARVQRLDEALLWFEKAHTTGDRSAAATAAEELVLAGRDDDAGAWCEQLPGVTTAEAARWTADAIAKAGRIDSALVWFERGADNGDASAYLSAAEILTDSGRSAEAIPWFERAAQADDAYVSEVAAEWLSLIKQERRALPAQLEESEGVPHDYAGGPVRAGEAVIAATITLGLDVHDRRLEPLGEVSRWAKYALRRHRPITALASAQQLARRGELEQALSMAEKAAAQGEVSALYWAAQKLADAGRWSEAFRWCRRAVATGSELAAQLAIVCLEELGCTAEAEHLDRYGWTADGDIASPGILYPENVTDHEAQAG